MEGRHKQVLNVASLRKVVLKETLGITYIEIKIYMF